MSKKKETFLKYFLEKRKLYASIFCILLFVLALVQQLYLGTGDWPISFIFLILGIVIIPFLSWLSFKGYMK